MATELFHGLLTALGHGVGRFGEDIAVGLGVVLSCLLRRHGVEVADIGPVVIGEVDAHVFHDFVGSTRYVDLDLFGDAWHVELPGRVDNCVQGHLAASVGGKKGVVIVKDGSVLRDNLI